MPDPFARFAEWLARAAETEPNDPNACALATVRDGPDGPAPNVRMVLMKHFDARGFVFYTNHTSMKGRELAARPVAAMDFHWKALQRQVRVRGRVAPVSDAESDAYFATRPRESQLSAWASRQSEPLARRADFETRLAAFAARFRDAVPRPPFWGGYRLAPQEIEFWEARPGRQHERELYTPDGSGWRVTLLFP